MGHHGRPREGRRGDGARRSTEAGGREAMRRSGGPRPDPGRGLAPRGAGSGPAPRLRRAGSTGRRGRAKLTGRGQLSGWKAGHPPRARPPRSAGKAGGPSPASRARPLRPGRSRPRHAGQGKQPNASALRLSSPHRARRSSQAVSGSGGAARRAGSWDVWSSRPGRGIGDAFSGAARELQAAAAGVRPRGWRLPWCWWSWWP